MCDPLPFPGLPARSGRRRGCSSRVQKYALGATVIGIAVLGGCDEVIVSTVPVALIEVSPANAEIVLGDTIEFQANLYDEASGRLSGQDVVWRSDDPSVVSIDSTGLAIAVGPGVAEVTATAEGSVGRASITVAEMPRIELSDNSIVYSVAAGTGSTPPREIRITNSGDGSLTNLSLSITYGEEQDGWLDASLASTNTPTTMTVTLETGTLDSGTYTATVRVRDPKASNSPATLDVTLQVEQDAPATPTGLSAEAESTSVIDVSWNDVAAEEEYELQRSTDGTSFSPLVTLDANDTTYRDAELNATTTYYYRVRACSGIGCSGYAGPVSATTEDEGDTAPAAPQNLEADAISPTAIRLTWTDAADNENVYKVERSQNGVVFTLLASLTPNSTAYTDSNLTPESTYYYRVQACRNAGGCSAYAGPVSATTDED